MQKTVDPVGLFVHVYRIIPCIIMFSDDNRGVDDLLYIIPDKSTRRSVTINALYIIYGTPKVKN